MSKRFFIAILIILCAAGCAGPGTVADDQGTGDTSGDVGTPDATPDTIMDAADDTVPDSMSDTIRDALLDSLPPDTAGDSATGDVGDQTDHPFHIALVADCHLLPLDPDYEPNSTVAALLRAIDAHGSDLAALFTLGDNIEDFMTTYEDTAAGYPILAIETLNELFAANLTIPWYLVLGNHDNRFADTFLGNDVPISRWLEYFDGTPHLPATWYSVKMGGFNFVVLFGSDGATDHSTNDTNIIMSEQEAWLRGELAMGMPTVLLYHQWIEPPAENSETLHPIHQAVLDYPGVVKATFAGHGHIFAHYVFAQTDFYQIGAAKTAGSDRIGGDDSWFLHDFGYVVCDPATGDVTIENYDNINWEQTY